MQIGADFPPVKESHEGLLGDLPSVLSSVTICGYSKPVLTLSHPTGGIRLQAYFFHMPMIVKKYSTCKELRKIVSCFS